MWFYKLASESQPGVKKQLITILKIWLIDSYLLPISLKLKLKAVRIGILITYLSRWSSSTWSWNSPFWVRSDHFKRGWVSLQWGIVHFGNLIFATFGNQIGSFYPLKAFGNSCPTFRSIWLLLPDSLSRLAEESLELRFLCLLANLNRANNCSIKLPWLNRGNFNHHEIN